jgi:hypothetical protein
MKLIELHKRAETIRDAYQTGSVTPKMVGSLASDTLTYISMLEQNLQALGIRKTYATEADMNADTAPMGDNGMPIRFGQLVTVSANGNIYKYDGDGSWSYVATLASDTVALDHLDAMVTDNAGVLAAMKDTRRYVVMSGEFVVGELHFLGDTMYHGVMQVFTTNLLLRDGTFDGSHSHVELHTYIRSYGFGNFLPAQWSEWTEVSGGSAKVEEGTLKL